mmetsp:Transcript_33866/g.52199  ORF Transcript_33866/g.52199 Transcript_33866/m.52199 type:complete len:93 (+) Transcript_33866:116-394(+)
METRVNFDGIILRNNIFRDCETVLVFENYTTTYSNFEIINNKIIPSDKFYASGKTEHALANFNYSSYDKIKLKNFTVEGNDLQLGPVLAFKV